MNYFCITFPSDSMKKQNYPEAYLYFTALYPQSQNLKKPWI